MDDAEKLRPDKGSTQEGDRKDGEDGCMSSSPQDTVAPCGRFSVALWQVSVAGEVNDDHTQAIRAGYGFKLRGYRCGGVPIVSDR